MFAPLAHCYQTLTCDVNKPGSLVEHHIIIKMVSYVKGTIIYTCWQQIEC